MSPLSIVLFPPAELASCMSIAILRDTRDCVLSDRDRVNYFPASPLIALTIVVQGRLRVSSEICDLATLRTKDVLPQVSVTPPQIAPTQSWSDGQVCAITVGFFPDAWALIGGDIGTETLPAPLDAAIAPLLAANEIEPAWAAFCDMLKPIWNARRDADTSFHWTGSHRVSDWTRHLLTKAALSGSGQSARSFERRMKRWTGHSKQTLQAFAQLEDLHGLRNEDPDAALAEIAADARFSDQSHMGRAVKKATGFSPGRLNRLIETDESFWCYRLLGERL